MLWYPHLLDLVDNFIVRYGLYQSLLSELVLQLGDVNIVLKASGIEQLALLVSHYELLLISICLVHQVLERAEVWGLV